MSEHARELSQITGVIKLTFRERHDECQDIINLFWRLCDKGDIAEDIYRAENAGLPYYVCTITIRAFLEMQANIFQGAYHSAGRSLRWLYENNVAGATACVNPSLLDDQYAGSTSLSLDEFETWLDRYDKNDVKLKRRDIFDYFGLPSADLNNLYYDLCKYVYVSRVSFDKEHDWPKLQYVQEKFDETFELLKKTMDLIFCMQSKMLLCYNGSTAGALKHFLNDRDSLNRYIPLTVSLISSLP